jgi:hypothetical protein
MNCQASKEYDIVLFSGIFSPLNHRPLAIYRLANHLRQNNIKVKTINYFNFMSKAQFDNIINRYVSKKTLIVGFSATVMFDTKTEGIFGMSDDDFSERINAIKLINSDVTIVAGGGQFNNADKDFFKKYKNKIDYVSVGQGENTILAIYNHIVNNSKLITASIEKPFVVNDITYPFTDFNLSTTQYIDDDNIFNGESLPLELARGCIFKCKYCSYDLTQKKFMDYTKTKSILEQEILENYKKYGTQHYYVVDDLINDSPEKVNLLYEITQKLPFKIYLTGYIRLDLLWRFKDMAQKLKDSGLVGAFMGIETINDRSGKAVGKGLGKKRIEEALLHCQNIWNGDVFIEAFFIAGLPHDSATTVSELGAWAVQQQNLGRFHQFTIQPLSINPTLAKSDIDKDPEKFGYKIIDLKYDSSTPTRHATKKASWTLANGYSWQQACADAERLSQLSKDFEPVNKLWVNTFNLSLINSLISSTPYKKLNFVHFLTKKITMSDKALHNFEHLIIEKNNQRLSDYYSKLLE